MAIETALIQTTFEHSSGLPQDRVVNTFHVVSPATGWTDVGATAVTESVAAWWTTNHNIRSMSSYLSKEISRATNACHVRAYNLADPEPRVPMADSDFTCSTEGSGSSMPTETAVCLSYRAALESGADMARRRNRMYLGPLCASAVTTITTPPLRPSSDVQNDWLASAQALWDALLGTGGTDSKWMVWSSILGPVGEPVYAWMDNALDTQRRRGVAATSRASVVIS